MYSDTQLTLADWAMIMGIHPTHFAQINFPAPSKCSQLYLQHPWQDRDVVARSEIAQAIAEAEELIERELNHFLTPRFVENEYVRVPEHYARELQATPYDIRGLALGVQTKWGEVLSGGVKATETLESGASIVYEDDDEDGYAETATITVSVSELYDKCEIHVYRPDSDNGMEVRPINVSPAEDQIVIKTRREYLVRAAKYESLSAQEIAYDNDENFLSEVDVVREYLDPSTQATLLWEPFNDCWHCGGNGCQSCAWETQAACIIPRSHRVGLVGLVPATWDSDEKQWTFQSAQFFKGLRPHIAKINYRSGLEHSECRLTGTWARAVAYFAASMLDRPPCDCSADAWRQWREDLALTDGGEDQHSRYRISNIDLSNPFGTRRGAVYAWRRVYDQRIAESTLLT